MANMTNPTRKFLVVSDETEECLSALVYAGLRARAIPAGLTVLRCIRVPGWGGWIGLDQHIEEDAIDSARLAGMKHVDLIRQRTGVEAELIVSQDEPVDAIRLLVDDDPTIKVLVLASGEGRGGPGPLVSRLGKGRPLADRPIAVTVVPGGLSDAQLDEMGGMVG